MFKGFFGLKTIDPRMQMLFMLCTGPFDQSEHSMPIGCHGNKAQTGIWGKLQLISLLSWQPRKQSEK